MTGTAGGTIIPSTFLVRSTTADAQFLQATGTAVPIAGISQKGTRSTPYDGLDDGNAAIAGENLQVYLPNDDKEAPLRLGGTVAAGDLLTSDAQGRGVTAASGNQVGARALMAGILDQIIVVQPLWGDAT
jgi:hypothetical protein